MKLTSAVLLGLASLSSVSAVAAPASPLLVIHGGAGVERQDLNPEEVRAARAAQLSLGVAGTVRQVFVEAGDAVQAGDALVQLDTADLARDVATAEQNLVIQEANLAELQDNADASDVAASYVLVTRGGDPALNLGLAFLDPVVPKDGTDPMSASINRLKTFHDTARSAYGLGNDVCIFNAYPPARQGNAPQGDEVWTEEALRRFVLAPAVEPAA